MRFSERTHYPALIIFSFLLSMCNRNTYFQTVNQYFVVYHFVSEWKRQVVIEQTQFLSTEYLLWVNFCRKNVYGNFYLRELIIADHWKNHKHRKQGRYFLLFWEFFKNNAKFQGKIRVAAALPPSAHPKSALGLVKVHIQEPQKWQNHTCCNIELKGNTIQMYILILVQFYP